MLLAVPPAAIAEPESVEDKLQDLNKRAKSLEKDYDGELLQYTEAKKRAQKSQKTVKKTANELKQARSNVRELASAQYKSSGLDPTVEVVMSSEPDQMLNDATLAQHISRNNGDRVNKLGSALSKHKKANDKAEDQLDDAKELIGDLEDQRDEVKKKIAKYKRQQIPGGGGDGGIPAKAKGPGWDGATPRMAAIRDDMVGKFGAPFPVGCLRPGDPGEHGSGRACDFMMSAGGASPSSTNRQLGQQMAEYAKNNADRLGVMYVIWEQKIWHSANPGAGWKPMEDRGSITQNHFDHVHVSSY
ncbi:hypothetical protein CLV63_109196 [Murinocardiopsis flavida]|uniref:ARB-07466-like C-terminal domain-containing protein n=2 Tax=Murinocardiopsis flavida TaxID=645275 RepID=A0A2P8DIY5_9ACTN|nr:hypothetical protein CLV63_109196 [Murinocardiopsis flavida]